MEQHITSINAALEAGRNLAIPGVVGRGAILWGKCDRLALGKDGSPYIQRWGKFKAWLFKHHVPAIVAHNQIVEG